MRINNRLPCIHEHLGSHLHLHYIKFTFMQRTHTCTVKSYDLRSQRSYMIYPFSI